VVGAHDVGVGELLVARVEVLVRAADVSDAGGRLERALAVQVQPGACDQAVAQLVHHVDRRLHLGRVVVGPAAGEHRGDHVVADDLHLDVLEAVPRGPAVDLVNPSPVSVQALIAT
jgi:hypothetical protein